LLNFEQTNFMAKTTAFIDLGFINLDRRKKQSLVLQMYRQLREAILSGQLKKGHRLPSTRLLAQDLRVSRMTVVNAFDQLTLEGYLAGNVGRGTYVSDQLPDEKLRVKCCASNLDTQMPERLTTPTKLFSRQGQRYLGTELDHGIASTVCIPFQPGIPAIDEFPIEAWSKMRRALWKKLGVANLSYGDPAGFQPLRTAIAEYVRAYRGVKCDDQQVVIVSGTQQAVDAVAKLATDPGDHVIFENPGYGRCRAVFLAANNTIVPVSIDRCGLNVDEAIAKAPNARIAYVTPSHQYPMGVTLSIERRIQLIEWANRNGSLIIEDDYDAEFRYCQRPIPALQGLDHGARTIYIGSLSKVVYPSLSMGYAIVPKPMVSPFVKAISLTSRPSPTFEQMAICEFIASGNFARHLRKMRSIHEQRRTVLVNCVEQYLGEFINIVGADAGLHCAATLKIDTRDTDISKRARDIGILLRPLSEYLYPRPDAGKKSELNGLVFGFASSTPTQIRSAVKRLAQIF
jgi:GntR family transcriptional regulator / MocR family aminotransferase